MWNTFSTNDLLERIPENVGQLLHKLLTHKDPRECGTPSPHTAHSSCPVVLSPIGPAPAKWVQGPPQRSPWSLPIPVGISRYSWYTMGYFFNEDFFFDWWTELLENQIESGVLQSCRNGSFYWWNRNGQILPLIISKSFLQSKSLFSPQKTPRNLTSISLSSMSVGWPWKQYSLVPAAFRFLSRSCRHSNRNRKRL